MRLEREWETEKEEKKGEEWRGVTHPDVRTIKDFKATKFKVLKDFLEKVDMLNRWAISAKS